MAVQELKVNQNIELEVTKGAYKGTYSSKIAEINDDNIKIMLPYAHGELVPLRPNVKMDVYFTGERAAYRFRTKILKREKEKIPLLVITTPGEFERIQRREYFRLEVVRGIEYCPVDDEFEPTGEFVESNTIDISGGGVKLVLKSEVEENEFLEMYIDIPEIEDLPITGEVVHIYGQGEDKSAGVEFIDINSRVRDVIIGWLFDYQRELRRKGLL